MVRPLHADGHPHWMENMARDDLFCPGNIITVEPSGLPPNRRIPHATEDRLILGEPTLSRRISHEEMVEVVSGSVHYSVQNLFGDDFTSKKYILENHGFRSLGAVEVNSKRMGFDYNYNKLKCWFYDGKNEKYSLPISCRALKAIHRQSGIEVLNDLKSGKGKAHIRLGLANAWDGQPGNNWNQKRCYAMVNGIFFV